MSRKQAALYCSHGVQLSSHSGSDKHSSGYQFGAVRFLVIRQKKRPDWLASGHYAAATHTHHDIFFCIFVLRAGCSTRSLGAPSDRQSPSFSRAAPLQGPSQP